MINRTTIAPLVALVFGILAFFKIGLPPHVTEETMIAVVMLGTAALTTVLRIMHGEPDTDGVKIWYHSKVLWTQFGAFLVACLAMAGQTIPGLDPDTFASSALIIATVLSVAFGWGNRKALG